jgi:hypothetical protein
MAIDLSKATKKAPVNASTLQTHANGGGFSGMSTPTGGGFAPTITAKPLNDYTTPTFATVPGPYDVLREKLKAANPGIPASFIDDEVDNFNKNRTRGGTTFSGTMDPSDPQVAQYLGQQIQNEWGQEGDKSRYISTDAEAKATQEQGNVIGGINRASNQITQGEQQAVGNFWDKNVTPALQGATKAAGAQVSGDRDAEAALAGLTGQYATDINGLEGQRMAGISDTNNQLTDLANEFRGATDATSANNSQWASTLLPTAQEYNAKNDALAENLWNQTNSTNSANSALGQQITQAALDTNANQTGLFNQLSGQASDINANQTGLFNTLSGQASSINDNQTQLFNELAAQAASSNQALSAANDTFQGQLQDLNQRQDQANDLFQGQLGELNGLDRSSLSRYMGETDPLMAAMHAQGSDPADVARQQDVINRYEELSHPQVTDQERLVAELARRKFESDDQSNRQALMQQLRGRGLQSGGLVVAGLQSANQQTANDRQIAELGLNAQAQQRAMQGMAGYSDSSNVLRNADDAMRNFQDQYAQNDATRRQNLAGQRETINLAETNQETGRDTTGFNAATTTNNNNTTRDSLGFDANRGTIADNYGRDESVFNAGTTTNNNNWTRDQGVFDAGTTTNNNNWSRDQGVFNAGTQTNEDNFGRTDTANRRNLDINQDNIGNTQFATTTQVGINDKDADRLRHVALDNVDINQTNLGNKGLGIGTQMQTVSGNNTRTQAGIDKGETASGDVLTARELPITTHIGNLNTEAGTAQGLAGTMTSAGSTFSNVQGGMSDESRKALEDMLARYGYQGATAAASKMT